MDKKPYGQHWCDVPQDLSEQFLQIFPEIRSQGGNPNNAIGNDIKKVTRSLDRGAGHTAPSVEWLLGVARSAKQNFPDLRFADFESNVVALNHFFPNSHEDAIVNAVGQFAQIFNHPTLGAVAKDLVDQN